MKGCYKKISTRYAYFNPPRLKKYRKINILERVYRFSLDNKDEGESPAVIKAIIFTFSVILSIVVTCTRK